MTEVKTKVQYNGEEWVRARPIQKIPKKNGEKKYRYSFGEVHIDDIPDNVTLPNGASIVERGDEIIVYQYRERPSVLVTPKACYAKKSDDLSDAEKQAYHCLSILDSKGLVSQWRKG